MFITNQDNTIFDYGRIKFLGDCEEGLNFCASLRRRLQQAPFPPQHSAALTQTRKRFANTGPGPEEKAPWSEHKGWGKAQ